MPRLIVFENVTLDGFFAGPDGDLSWAHNPQKDPEWDRFVADNASRGGRLLLGRKTYDLMASYWPTPRAAQNDPEVAKGMNSLPKVVFSKTLDKPAWSNTTVKSGDLADEVRKMKKGSGGDIAVLGSGSIVSQLEGGARRRIPDRRAPRSPRQRPDGVRGRPEEARPEAHEGADVRQRERPHLLGARGVERASSR